MLVKNKNTTIAILPFDVLGSDKRIKILFRGFTEDLINNFSKFLGISVISHISTFHITDLTNQTLINQLGADFLVIGSVLPKGKIFKISIQLVKAENKSLIFSSQYHESLESLLKTQDSIINQIVSALQEKINIDLLSHSYKKSPIELAAYENYLLGMNILQKGNADSDLKSREYFKAALEINPHYSLAYSGLSLSYFNFWSCLLWDRWDINKKGSFEYAKKAIELDPNDYVALGILGRNYVYLEQYEKAEHCLRKSLRMNSSDVSHLLRASYSFLFLGYPKEALELYHEAIRLNPFHGDNYFAYGSGYYLELGDFEQCIALGKKTNLDTFIDFPAWIAAAYLQLNKLEEVFEYWDIYLKQFEKDIYSKKYSLEQEALDWLIVINPFKNGSYLDNLSDFIKTQKRLKHQSIDSREATSRPKFILQGNVWEISYKNYSVILKDAKGYHDIYKMLLEPEKTFHCLELMGSSIDENAQVNAIDSKAKSSYLKRIKDLQLDIEEAENLNQTGKLEKLRQEYEDILEHLSSSLGLSGKSRKVGSTVEKARSAVTWRIRNVIKKIQDVHPELGLHLSQSIKTGTSCIYSPGVEVNWVL